jgi:hypothetical protein
MRILLVPLTVLSRRFPPPTPTIMGRYSSHSSDEDKPKVISYASKNVTIPPQFLTSLAHDSKPILTSRIDFVAAGMPQYKDSYALVLENVLSPSECTTLLSLVEQSAINEEEPWQPALVNVGGNKEVAAPGYRESDRIIWDQQTVVDRLMDRILQADSARLARDVDTIVPPAEPHPVTRIAQNVYEKVAGAVPEQRGANPLSVLGTKAGKTQHWKFTRGNERMRFLRYKPGNFFDRHCDGSYVSPADERTNKPQERTLFTVHLYLSGNDEEDIIEGGSTAFFGNAWGKDGEVRADVEAKTGRVLVFQHRGMWIRCRKHMILMCDSRVGALRRTCFIWHQVHDADGASIQTY